MYPVVKLVVPETSSVYAGAALRIPTRLFELLTLSVFESTLISPVTVNEVSVPTLVKLLEVTPAPSVVADKTDAPLILYVYPVVKLVVPETSSVYAGAALRIPTRLFALLTLSVFESTLMSPVTVNDVSVPTLVKLLEVTPAPSVVADKTDAPLMEYAYPVVKLAFPDTSSNCEGTFVPIPTFPEDLITIC